MSGGLSTHVLDLAKGKPAAGLAITLTRGEETLFKGVTNSDGRCPELLPGPLEAGGYELVFDVAGYFAAAHPGVTPFFPTVTVAFAISDPASHHHVPLLLSPFGYSTYRGS